jgi:hypothetical protein
MKFIKFSDQNGNPVIMETTGICITCWGNLESEKICYLSVHNHGFSINYPFTLYQSRDKKFEEFSKLLGIDNQEDWCRAETEADARAKMLIYSLENKLIEIEVK